jgi:hypothetical protein
MGIFDIASIDWMFDAFILSDIEARPISSEVLRRGRITDHDYTRREKLLEREKGMRGTAFHGFASSICFHSSCSKGTYHDQARPLLYIR